ncbi:hypothetical protein IFR04_009459 [Cadophora malorum]|uniref:Uncharacterized protein n=1 Tax=Cadophora malorum TaxID=108018 RepID=A0A8H7T9G7_9HELO|nr:hypothetical protein IFR04_009459 [Cadophora malorum]
MEGTALIGRGATQETRHLISRQSDPSGESAPIDDEIIWNEFRACRQSAEYYRAEYLLYRKAVHDVPKHVQPAETAVTQGETSGSNSFWRMKIARDFFIRDLRGMTSCINMLAERKKEKSSGSLPFMAVSSMGFVSTLFVPGTLSVVVIKDVCLLVLSSSVLYGSYNRARYCAMKQYGKAIAEVLEQANNWTVQEEAKDNLRSSWLDTFDWLTW